MKTMKTSALFFLLMIYTTGMLSQTLFSVPAVADGDYLVTAVIGGEEAGETTLRVESRRSYVENLVTPAGTQDTIRFLVHKRSPRISDGSTVRIKEREQGKLDWDDQLTFEVNGAKPMLASFSIEPALQPYTTLFLCGNSTVVNQDEEPWCSWGQIIPRFFDEQVCVANYAESGETAASFRASLRWAKVMSLLRAGDYVFMEFGHNDEKIQGEGKGAFLSFYQEMKQFVEEVRSKGGIPVVLSPTERRIYDANGALSNSHGDYPEAVFRLSQETHTRFIDLNGMTRILYKSWGREGSKKAFVHYPANTFPHQETALADNTHFNSFGAYEIAQCVLQSIKEEDPNLYTHVVNFKGFNLYYPDRPENFTWAASPFIELTKPDGN
jgi:lysophospholipase L1-like esterase